MPSDNTVFIIHLATEQWAPIWIWARPNRNNDEPGRPRKLQHRPRYSSPCRSNPLTVSYVPMHHILEYRSSLDSVVTKLVTNSVGTVKYSLKSIVQNHFPDGGGRGTCYLLEPHCDNATGICRKLSMCVSGACLAYLTVTD
jgi:hypothetical protein